MHVYPPLTVWTLTSANTIRRAVNDRYDVRETILHHLINGCLDLNGVVSKNLRKRYADRVDDVLFDFIETEAKKALEQCGLDSVK